MDDREALRPNFSPGDATLTEIVRIEWPSGIVQELHNVAANQILTVTEPAKLEPFFNVANGAVELKVKSWPGFVDQIQASTNLIDWTQLTTLTNLSGVLQFSDAAAGNSSQRFYRLLAP